MDKDRVEGSSKQAKGAIKDTAGKVTGDTKLQTEGKADKAAGQKAVLPAHKIDQQGRRKQNHDQREITLRHRPYSQQIKPKRGRGEEEVGSSDRDEC